MREECQTLARDTARTIVDPLPAIECHAWCEDGNGHVDQRYPEDQGCWGPKTEVKLGGYGLIELSDGELVRDWLEVYNAHYNDERAPHVHILHEADEKGLPMFSLALSKSEALALADALREHAEQL